MSTYLELILELFAEQLWLLVKSSSGHSSGRSNGIWTVSELLSVVCYSWGVLTAHADCSGGTGCSHVRSKQRVGSLESTIQMSLVASMLLLQSLLLLGFTSSCSSGVLSNKLDQKLRFFTVNEVTSGAIRAVTGLMVTLTGFGFVLGMTGDGALFGISMSILTSGI